MSKSPNFRPHQNLLLYATDGYVAEKAQLIKFFDTIVLDECHKLTAARELICSVVRSELTRNRDNLRLLKRVIIMSATLLKSLNENSSRQCSFDKLVAFFKSSTEIQVLIPLADNRTMADFSITNVFAGPKDTLRLGFEEGKRTTTHEEMYTAVVEGLFACVVLKAKAVNSDTYPGVFVFVPRKEDCNYIVAKLRSEHECLAVPFYSGYMESQYNDIIFNPQDHQRHRIIIATNVAESSVMHLVW